MTGRNTWMICLLMTLGCGGADDDTPIPLTHELDLPPAPVNGPAGMNQPISDRQKNRFEAIEKIEELGGSYRSHTEQVLFIDADITDADLKWVVPVAYVETLKLSNTPITDAGLIHILSLPNLRKLSLNGTQVTDRGMQHLETMAALRTLDIRQTQVSDAGLDSIKKFGSLRTLYISPGQLSESGIESLQAVLPKCQIIEE